MVLVTVGAGGGPVDSRTVAVNWLRSQYDCQPGSAATVTEMDVYKRYLSACNVSGLQEIVSPATFAACIR